MAQAPGPLPPVSAQWISQSGSPATVFQTYFLTLDAAVRALTSSINVNATNDAAAAKAGVKVGQLYRNGSAVMIRVS